MHYLCPFFNFVGQRLHVNLHYYGFQMGLYGRVDSLSVYIPNLIEAGVLSTAFLSGTVNVQQDELCSLSYFTNGNSIMRCFV